MRLIAATGIAVMLAAIAGGAEAREASIYRGPCGQTILPSGATGLESAIRVDTSCGMFSIDEHGRSEEHTSELQSHSDLHSFPTRRSSDLPWPVRSDHPSERRDGTGIGNSRRHELRHVFHRRTRHRVRRPAKGPPVDRRAGLAAKPSPLLRTRTGGLALTSLARRAPARLDAGGPAAVPAWEHAQRTSAIRAGRRPLRD